MESQTKKVFPVGKFIKDELLTRGWTQADLAHVMGRKATEISSLMVGRRQLSPELAQELGVVLGRGAEYWLGLDNAYRLSQTDHVDQAVLLRSELFSFPVKEMQKRRWIAETLDTGELQQELDRFFSDDALGKPRPDSYELPFETSFKRTIKESSLNNSEKAWLARARQLAKACPVANFNENSVPKLKAELRRLTAKTQAAHRVPALLAGAGIRYVVVEPLPTVKIDGAAFWLDAESPVIAMSMRFDNIGSFWFALMHELDHIEYKDTFSFDDLQSKPNDEAEERASWNAANLLVPKHELEEFIKACAPRYSEARINNFATRLQIHPGIIVGQLQHRGELSYAAHRKLLTKVRDLVTQFAFTDGWGQPIPQLLG
ncbi:MAG TPA: ImmA/IrrE family metallo-endopeptidase [Opitutaceae bacterium]|nr:ImmA/IrrE family metallo-endopeptidase [Opitutaceae bacterium]